jgi:hypothetical protein
MHIVAVAAVLAASLLAGPGPAAAASAEQEQAFIDTYKAAFAAGDAATLRALMFSDNAIPDAIEFYEMMMTVEFGYPIKSIDLVDLDAEDLARIDETMPSPGGTMARLAPRPYKKMVIVIDTSDASGTGTSTSTAYIAEHDGRLGIAMPVPAN